MTPFRTTSTQKPFHIGFNTGYFPPIRLSTINDHFYAHPLSHPWACFALHRKDRYWISITPVNTKALFITICTCPSKSVLSFSFLVLSCILKKINKPAVTQNISPQMLRLTGCDHIQGYNKPAMIVLA